MDHLQKPLAHGFGMDLILITSDIFHIYSLFSIVGKIVYKFDQNLEQN